MQSLDWSQWCREVQFIGRDLYCGGDPLKFDNPLFKEATTEPWKYWEAFWREGATPEEAIEQDQERRKCTCENCKKQ